jgi:hypothetical protein
MYASGALTGAAAVALALIGFASIVRPFPSSAASVVAFYCAGVIARIFPNIFPGSRWRIPKSWGARGSKFYAAVFGLVLGAGFVTALPSPSFYVLLAWGASAASVGGIFAGFLAFALARAAPIVLLAIREPLKGAEVGILESIRSAVARSRPLEVGVLVALALTFLRM